MSFHFPPVICILVSIVLTVVLNLVLRWFKRQTADAPCAAMATSWEDQ